MPKAKATTSSAAGDTTTIRPMALRDISTIATSPSNILTLVSTTLLGLLIGFGICYRTVHQQHEAALHQLTAQHRSTLDRLQASYQSVKQQHTDCRRTTTSHSTLASQLQAQLDAHRPIVQTEYPQLVQDHESCLLYTSDAADEA